MPADFDRRDFLRLAGVGAGVVFASGLAGCAARADVEDRARVAELGVHPGGEPRVGAALAAVAVAVGGVVDVAGDG